MRALLLISLCLGVLAQADELQSCAGINSAVERLNCFDQLVKNREDAPAPVGEAAPAAPVTLKSKRIPTTRLQPLQERVREVVETQPDKTNYEPEGKSSRWNLFGLKPKRDKSKDISRINAILDRVEYMGNGKKVFTLSNGQVWIERESTPQKIAAGQAVTITKKRWHFELDPERGPKVTVERLDPDRNIVRVKNRGKI